MSLPSIEIIKTNLDKTETTKAIKEDEFDIRRQEIDGSTLTLETIGETIGGRVIISDRQLKVRIKLPPGGEIDMRCFGLKIRATDQNTP